MRILLEMESLQDAKYNLVHNYIIQSFIYNLLKDTEFAWIHSHKDFKFFNFSNIFPVEDFKFGNTYNLIISSPNAKLINVIYKKLKEIEEIKLGTLIFKLKKLKKFKLKLRFPWETATPIILRKGVMAYLSDGFKIYKVFLKSSEKLKEFKKEKIRIEGEIKEIKEEDLKYLDKKRFRVLKIDDIYYSFEKGDNFFEWLEDLKKQSLLKYNTYTGYNFDFDGPLFDVLEPRFSKTKDVVVRLRIKNKGEAIYIGSLWKKLDLMRKLDRSEKKFYQFLLDTGLGNLNSMGFGFINIKTKNRTRF